MKNIGTLGDFSKFEELSQFLTYNMGQNHNNLIPHFFIFGLLLTIIVITQGTLFMSFIFLFLLLPADYLRSADLV